MDKTKIHKMWIADQGDGTYTNPILYTDYSDPDAIRVGEDYFMIASSFCNTPAVPLLHSSPLSLPYFSLLPKVREFPGSP